MSTKSPQKSLDETDCEIDCYLETCNNDCCSDNETETLSINKSSTENPKKSQKSFSCEKCNYHTCNYKDYKKHIVTKKHKSTHINHLSPPNSFMCEICNKTYKDRSGLWRHKKVCIKPEPNLNNIPETSLISLLVQQNADLAKMQTENMGVFTEKITNLVLELCKNGITNMNNSQYANNSHNKFNLQFFLNETCKNAMNIMDFVESIQLQVSDLERIGELGYVKGMSEIITTNLKAMDISLRPIHCTDKKRETMYIRDNNEWKKEEDNKPYLRKAIKKIEDRNMRLFPQYRAKYPDHNNPHSKQSDKYDKMVLEALGGSKNEKDNIERIIRNISEVTIVDK